MPQNNRIDRAKEAASEAMKSADSWPFWLERGMDTTLDKITLKWRGYDWLVIVTGWKGAEPVIVFYSSDFAAMALGKFDNDARNNKVPWKPDEKRAEWLAQTNGSG